MGGGGARANRKKPRMARRGFLALLNSSAACFGLLFSQGNPFGRGTLADRNNPQPFRNSQSYPLPAE